MDWTDEMDNLITEVLHDGVSPKEVIREVENAITRYFESDEDQQ